MGYEKASRLHQSALFVAVMAALATLLDWFPAQLLHIEPVKFRGFGLFCISRAMLLSFLVRQDEATQSVSVLLAEFNACCLQPASLLSWNCLKSCGTDTWSGPTHQSFHS